MALRRARGREVVASVVLLLDWTAKASDTSSERGVSGGWRVRGLIDGETPASGEDRYSSGAPRVAFRWNIRRLVAAGDSSSNGSRH